MPDTIFGTGSNDIFGSPYPQSSRVDVKLKPYPGDALANNDRSSLAAFYNAREQAVREQIIAHQMVQVHRNKVSDRPRCRAPSRPVARRPVAATCARALRSLLALLLARFSPPRAAAQLIACYHREGVNHYQNCRKIAQEFVEIIHKPNFGALTPAKTDDE